MCIKRKTRPALKSAYKFQAHGAGLTMGPKHFISSGLSDLSQVLAKAPAVLMRLFRLDFGMNTSFASTFISADDYQ